MSGAGDSVAQAEADPEVAGTPGSSKKKSGRGSKKAQVATAETGDMPEAGSPQPAKRGRGRGGGRGSRGGGSEGRGRGRGRGGGGGGGRGKQLTLPMKQEVGEPGAGDGQPSTSAAAAGSATPKKRGRPSKAAAAAAATPTPQTGTANEEEEDEAEGDFSYNDLFSSGEDVVSEDSEYEPTAEEMRMHARQMGGSKGKKSRGRGRNSASGGSRKGRGRGRGGMAMAEAEVSSEDDEEDEDDDDDDDDDMDDEDEDDELLDEDDESGMEEMDDEDDVALFQDAAGRGQPEQKDIYDFDAQSIISSQQDKKGGAGGKLKIPKPQAGRLAAVQQRQTKSAGQSWGSNIYSSVATALKSRDDLDIYTQFLKMRHKNEELDGLYTDLCKPSSQHSGMFYGPSASLQSMMSRINDHDKVVEILHDMMDKEYAHLAHNVAYMLPITSQPMLGSERLPTMEPIAKPIDRRMRLEYAYSLNLETNVLAPKFDVGHHPGDVQTIIVSDIAYEKFRSLVTSGSPNSLRLTLAVNEEGDPLAIALLDTWLRAEVPHNRVRVEKPTSLSGIEEKPTKKKVMKEASAEEEVRDLLNEIIDWVFIRTEESPADGADNRRRFLQHSAANAQANPLASANIQLKDAILLKPNGKKDVLLIITGRQPDHKIYAIMSEYRLMYQRYGFAKDTPITLEGMYNAYPEDLMSERGLLVVPDILFKAFKKLSMKNVSNNAPPDCKFALLDRSKRTPLSIVVMTTMAFVLRRDGRKPKKEQEIEQGLAGMLSDEDLESVRKEVERKGEANEQCERFQLVVLNGQLYGMQMADVKTKMVKRFVTLLPQKLYLEAVAKHSSFSPPSHGNFWAKKKGRGPPDGHVTIHVTDEESGNTTYCVGSVFSKYQAEEQFNVISYFVDNLCDLVFDHSVSTSLYDQVFRLAQANTPDLVEAPSGENQAIEQWGVCSICAKELKSHAVMFDHELRHLGITKFKCPVHELTFTDRKQYKQHLDEQHAGSGGKDEKDGSIPLVDSDDEAGTTTSQSHILKAMLQRMEAPQCDKCGDYFPSAEVYAQHFEVCDKISFQMRSPLPRAANSAKNIAASSAGAASTTCVCGLCGQTLSNRDKIRRHFISLHLTCCVCQGQGNTIEELAYHMKDHLTAKGKFEDKVRQVGDESNLPPEDVIDSKTLKDMRKILKCEVCNDFHSTRYTFFFHQWTEHGLIHPPLQASDLANLSKTADDSVMGPPMTPQRRKKLRLFKDELSYQATGLKKFNCKLCSTEIRVTGNEYVKHLQAKHGLNADINCVCRICAELFGTTEQLSEHLKEEHVPSGEFSNAGIQTIFACDKCPFWGFNKTLLQHSIGVHGEEAPAMYACPHCGERFKDRKFWRTHLDRHSDQLTHECHVCHKAFRMRQTLLQHIRNTHIDNADGPVTCDYCGQVYPRRVSLRHHIYRMHTIEGQEMRFECDICARRFRLETEMRRHVKEMHSGAMECDICNKMCPNLRCLTQHRQKHFRTRIYQCTDCQATFKSKLAMKRHIRVEHLQLGPEKFQCQICGKVVTQIAMHMLIHKDARFECQICGKKFTKSAYYNEHIRIHRGEKPFECQICGKRFNKKSNLNVHVKFHEKHRDQEGNYLEIKPRGRYAAQLKKEKAAQDKVAAAASKVDACVDTSLDDPNSGVECYPTGQRRESDACVDTSDLEIWIMAQQQAEMPPPSAIGVKRSMAHMISPGGHPSMEVENGASGVPRQNSPKRFKIEPASGRNL